MTLMVHVSGDNKKFVDGERDDFVEYAGKKAQRIEKLSNGTVLNVRISAEGSKFAVSLDVDGNDRVRGIGTTAFSAIDRATDTLANILRKRKDIKTGHKGNQPMGGAPGVSYAPETVEYSAS